MSDDGGLRNIVLGWANDNQEDCDDWVEELKKQKIRSMAGLVEMASAPNREQFIEKCFSFVLQQKMRKWYESASELVVDEVSSRRSTVKSVSLKRKYSDYFGEVSTIAISIRTEYIPGLILCQENTKGDDEENDLVDIEFEFLSMNDFPPLMHSQPLSNQILVRPCYKVIYDQLFAYLMNNNPFYTGENLTVTGNPGIGKSRFYLYCIHRFTKDGMNGRHLVINFGNVYQLYDANQREFQVLDINGRDREMMYNRNVLRLVEAKSSELTGWHGVSILFASPGVEGLHNYQKTLHLRNYIMPVWSCKELETLNEKVGYPLSGVEVGSRFAFFGGIPRFVFGEGFDLKVYEAVNSDKVFEILRFVKGNDPVTDGHYTHLLLKMCPACETFDSEYYLDLLSDQIAALLYDRGFQTAHHELVKFMIENRNNRNTASVRGRFYTIFCHRRFTRGIELSCRNLETGKELKIDIRDGIQERRFSSLDEITDLQLGDRIYFIPNSKIFGALDSFYWNGSDCFVFQMTISSSHHIAHAKLSSFVRWFRSLSKGSIFFVFVVPSRVFETFQKQPYVASNKSVVKRIASEISRLQQFVVSCDEFQELK